MLAQQECQRNAIGPEHELRGELRDLERYLRVVSQRWLVTLHWLRFNTCDQRLRSAEQEKANLLGELDRLMTRMRVIEGQLLQISRSPTPTWGL